MAAYRVTPLRGPVAAVVEVPGSKSVANRALICAALADGTSTLTNVPDGDDTEAMLTCLDLLGVGLGRTGERVLVNGCAGVLRPGPVTLPTRLAGTTSRFVTALAALGVGPYCVDGEPPLRTRPMGPLHDALVSLGATVSAGERWGNLPVTIAGPVRGAERLDVPGDISSQFLTALMLIGPYLPGGLRITVTTPLVSRSYLEITKAVMAEFGHDDVTVGDGRIVVGEGRYQAGNCAIEPDASSASYPLAAAAICGGRVEVHGLTKSAVQGDAAFCDVLAAMGCTATRTDVSTVVEGASHLHGIDIDMVDLSDLVPTLAAVALFAESPTRIRGVGFIRGKESDRLGDLCKELRRLGAHATESDDGLIIEPSPLRAASLDTHHDHRLAMSFGLIGLRVDDVEVDDVDVVAKSWPGYWKMLEGLQ
jgi:3-phosphoshikimate 1-carboxyvinyltransferase